SGRSVRPPGGPASASDLVPLDRSAVPLGTGPRGERLVEVLLTEGSGAGGRALEVRQQLLQRPPRAVEEHQLVVADAVIVLAGQDDDSRHGCLLVRHALLPATPGADQATGCRRRCSEGSSPRGTRALKVAKVLVACNNRF